MHESDALLVCETPLFSLRLNRWCPVVGTAAVRISCHPLNTPPAEWTGKTCAQGKRKRVRKKQGGGRLRKGKASGDGRVHVSLVGRGGEITKKQGKKSRGKGDSRAVCVFRTAGYVMYSEISQHTFVIFIARVCKCSGKNCNDRCAENIRYTFHLFSLRLQFFVPLAPFL